MQIFGTSVAVKLAVSAENVVSIASQEKSFVSGLLNEAVGMVDGGLSTSVGLSHTVGEVAKVALGAKFAEPIRNLPGVGQFLQ